MDKRANNGGNSTKSNNPNDKRKSEGRALLDQYIQEGVDYQKLAELLNKLYAKGLDGDTKSASLFLSYILGRPKETKDITTNGESLNLGSIGWYTTDEEE